MPERSDSPYFVLTGPCDDPKIQENHARGIALAIRQGDAVAQALAMHGQTLGEIKELVSVSATRLTEGDRTIDALRRDVKDLREDVTKVQGWTEAHDKRMETRRGKLLEWVGQPLVQAGALGLVALMLAGAGLTLYRMQHETGALLETLREHRQAAE